MNNPEIQLRPIEERDAENVVRWRNSDEVRRNLFTQSLLTVEQHLNYYRAVVCAGRCRQYIITLMEPTETDIGTIFLKNIDWDSREAEYGIFIGEPIGRGRNCAFPATEAVLQIAFREMELRRVYLFVVEDNEPAIRTYLKAGFRETGRESGRFQRDGRQLDVIAMEITSENWRCGEYE